MKLEVIEYLSKSKTNTSPLLFVHGAWHGAWCWEEYFLPYFSNKGYTSYAISLRGHGKSEGYKNIEDYSLKEYVEDVLSVVNTFEKQPILIGHSMGGAVVQMFLNEYQDKVKAAVLMASVYPGRPRIVDILHILFTHPTLLIRMSLFNQSKVKPKLKGTKLPYECLFSPDLEEEKRELYMSYLKPESNKAINDTNKRLIEKAGEIGVPILVMGTAMDWFFPKGVLERTGKFYKTKPIIFQNIGHDMMLDTKWEMVAEGIHKYLAEKFL